VLPLSTAGTGCGLADTGAVVSSVATPEVVVRRPRRPRGAGDLQKHVRRMYAAPHARFTKMDAEPRGNEGMWNVRGHVNGDFFQCQVFWVNGEWDFGASQD